MNFAIGNSSLRKIFVEKSIDFFKICGIISTVNILIRRKILKNAERTTRIAYIIEAGFEYFVSLFVTGTFLGYILDALGFNDAMQGIISTVATFTCGAQLFALVLTNKKVKKIVTIGHLINQLCFVLLYLLPIFDFSANIKTVVLIVLLFSGHIINNAINPAKITMLMASVEDKKRGSFTAIKEMVSLAGGMAVSIALGRVADIYRDADGLPTTPYYIICCVALVLMMAIHITSLLVSTEKPMPERPPVPVLKTVKRLATNADLMNVVCVGVIWNIASGFSASFLTSYVREELAFTFTTITIISALSSICRIAVSPFMGKLADKKSFSYTMTLCFVLAGIGFLGNCFTMPETRWLHLIYICLHSIAMAGINSGIINLVYDYVKPEERAVAMGVQNALGGILGFVAALIGGVILASIQSNGGFDFFGINIYAQQVLSAITVVFVIGLVFYMRIIIAPMKRVAYSATENEADIA